MHLGRYSALFTGLVVSTVMLQVAGYDNNRNDNMAVYWGQNSYGATHGSDTANWQKTLSMYCRDSTINAIPLAFLNVFFSTGGLPEINLSNICSADSGVFPGTNLANCHFLTNDIQTCQAAGKIVTLSIGGTGCAATLSSDSQGRAFADTVWNLFLGGSSSTRPFGNAVLDGVDLDIEGGGSTGFAAFVTQLRSHFNGASKRYYVTGAPQCPFPDANMGAILNAVSFDAVYVQYNNFCGVSNPSAFNFGTWDNWAKTISPNPNVKIYIGAPASPTAAGSGYVDATTLGKLAKQTRSQYSSFGGIMLWDASQAFTNGMYDQVAKNTMGTDSKPPPTSTTTTAGDGSGSCAGVAAWSSTIGYNGGSRVVYNGHLWAAKWWTQGDRPGGAEAVWTDNGACSARVATAYVKEATTAHSAPTLRAPHSAPPASTSEPHNGAVPSGASAPKQTNMIEERSLKRAGSRLFKTAV